MVATSARSCMPGKVSFCTAHDRSSFATIASAACDRRFIHSSSTPSPLGGELFCGLPRSIRSLTLNGLLGEIAANIADRLVLCRVWFLFPEDAASEDCAYRIQSCRTVRSLRGASSCPFPFSSPACLVAGMPLAVAQHPVALVIEALRQCLKENFHEDSWKQRVPSHTGRF